MPVGEPVDRHDGLDEVVLPPQVVGGAQRARAPDIADQDRLAGRDAVAVHRQAAVDALPAAGDGHLGRPVGMRGAVGVEQDRRAASDPRNASGQPGTTVATPAASRTRPGRRAGFAQLVGGGCRHNG